ncbi:MAG: 4Fe-4S binding protein, partial [Planctomycetes bacterium]|nr:4Fe-4S binding protein [Planctomycetota bacterium]
MAVVVDQEACVGCESCVPVCPVEAISMVDETARIDEQECIRCGRCHDVCPEEAVRHDSERIPQEIEANLDWT